MPQLNTRITPSEPDSKTVSMNFPRTARSFNPFPMTKHTVLPSLLLLALGLFAGCRTIPYDTAGQNYAVFQFGEFKGLVNTKAPAATQAVQKAVQQLDLFQTYVVVNKFEGQVLARTRNDQKVRINIEETNSLQTTIRIRWGEGGDVSKSRKLFDAIEANLK